MSADAFHRTLQSVLTGTRQLEDMCRVLVSSAVEDALLCVSRDYGHEYSALLARYKDDVVSRHISGSLTAQTTCRGHLKNGKACTKRALVGGYCHQHAVQMTEEATKKRKVEAYRASARPSREKDLLVDLFLGQKHVKNSSYTISGAQNVEF